MTVEAAVAPPHPPIPRRNCRCFGFLRAIRTNALTMWTEAAYQEDVLVRRVLGRSNMLLNAPDAIHRVLVDNPRELPPHAGLDPHPAPDHRHGPAAQRGRGLAPPAPHHRAGAGAAEHADAGTAHRDLRAGGARDPRRAGRRAGRSACCHAEPGARDRRPLDVLLEMRAIRPRDAPAAHRIRPCATRIRICSTWCCRRRSRHCAILAAGGSSAHGWA